MRRARAYRDEIGKTAIVFLNEGDSVSGTLHLVTDDDIILEVQDLLGEYVGIRHTVPWDSIYRVMTMDALVLESLMPEEDLPRPSPDWVAEVLAGAGDGTV